MESEEVWGGSVGENVGVGVWVRVWGWECG